MVSDVFESDRTYLGQVRLPERTSVAAIRGEELWIFQRGELDEPYVVRDRIETAAPSEGSAAGAVAAGG